MSNSKQSVPLLPRMKVSKLRKVSFSSVSNLLKFLLYVTAASSLETQVALNLPFGKFLPKLKLQEVMTPYSILLIQRLSPLMSFSDA